MTTPTDLNKAPEIVSLTGAPTRLEMDYGTPEAELGLPGSLTATYDNGVSAEVSVTWVCVSDGGYDPEPDDPTIVYSFEPVLDTGAVCAADLALPKVSVSLVLPRLMTLGETATVSITSTRGTLSYSVDGLPEGVSVASQQWTRGSDVVGTEATYTFAWDNVLYGDTISLSLTDSNGTSMTASYNIANENSYWSQDSSGAITFTRNYDQSTTEFLITGSLVHQIIIPQGITVKGALLTGEVVIVRGAAIDCTMSGLRAYVSSGATVSGGSITAASTFSILNEFFRCYQLS